MRRPTEGKTMETVVSRMAIVATAGLLLVVAACSGTTTGPTNAPTTAGPTAPTSPTTTTSPIPTTQAPTSTTTIPGYQLPDGRYTLGTPSLTPPVSLGTDGASGSGCPPVDHLPDGIWFGYAPVIEANGIEFEPACFFFGQGAVAKATEEDGVEMPPNPFYIRPAQSPTLQILTLAETPVHVLVASEEVGFETMPFDAWGGFDGGYTPCPGELCTVWVAVNEGVISEVMEQYLP